MKKALVIGCMLVLGLGIGAFAAPLSGLWETTVTIDPQGPTYITGFDSTLTVDYTVNSWVFGSVTGFELAGWTTQEFSADGVLGAFTFGSDLVFDPANAAFTSWDSTASVSIAGVNFDGEFLLMGGTDWGAGWTFGVSGVAGNVSIGVTTYFNMDADGNLVQTGTCDVFFSGIDIDIGLPFACIEEVDIDITFTCEGGFDGIGFSVVGIAVPAWSWLTFDAELRFDEGVHGKVLTLTPVLDLGEFTCITLYYSLLYDNGESCDEEAFVITGIEFYGIGLEYTFNGFTFTSLSALGNKNLSDLDEDLPSEYWEVFTIAGEADSCCGGLFSIEVATYFDCDSTFLFDWGETDVTLEFGVGPSLTFSTGLVIDDSPGVVEWTLGFEVIF